MSEPKKLDLHLAGLSITNLKGLHDQMMPGELADFISVEKLDVFNLIQALDCYHGLNDRLSKIESKLDDVIATVEDF